jgi:hypothetical protein
MAEFRTYEEWYQAEGKRRKNRKTWSYPTVPVYLTCCLHKGTTGKYAGTCPDCKNTVATFDTMKTEYRESEYHFEQFID